MTMRKIKPEKMDKMADGPMKSMPSVYFDGDTLPEGKDWKVGTTYKLALHVKMRGMSMRKMEDGKEHSHYDFDVVGIEPGGTVKGKVERYT